MAKPCSECSISQLLPILWPYMLHSFSSTNFCEGDHTLSFFSRNTALTRLIINKTYVFFLGPHLGMQHSREPVHSVHGLVPSPATLRGLSAEMQACLHPVPGIMVQVPISPPCILHSWLPEAQMEWHENPCLLTSQPEEMRRPNRHDPHALSIQGTADIKNDCWTSNNINKNFDLAKVHLFVFITLFLKNKIHFMKNGLILNDFIIYV